MTEIVRAKTGDVSTLEKIGKLSFIETHGNSASKNDIDEYVENHYSEEKILDEIKNDENIYHIILYNHKPVGYSKMIFNSYHSNIPEKNITKLDRIYLLKEYYSLNLGKELFNFNVDLSQKNNQAGMWLYVWKENYRAIKFYQKFGFEIIGSFDFKISETHSNPNHQMFLKYQPSKAIIE